MTRAVRLASGSCATWKRDVLKAGFTALIRLRRAFCQTCLMAPIC